MFARGVTGFKQAQLVTMAQNLAEFQVEDLKNIAPSALNELVRGVRDDVNYPYASMPLSGDPEFTEKKKSYDFDQTLWGYDSGKIETDFRMDGVEKLLKDRIDDSMAYWIDPPEFEAVKPATEIDDVPIPTEDQILLGDNIVVEVYTDDLVLDRRYWYDHDTSSWYYLWVDADGETQRKSVTLADPANMLVYYHVTLQKEAYPLFSRQIRIAQYDAGAPDSFEPLDINDPGQALYHTSQDGATTKFDYEITIWYKQDGVDRVLFRSGGTVAWPLASLDAGRSIA